MMTTAEVAAYLRLKERTIYDLVAKRRIPCSRVSGKLLFPRRLIDRWIEHHAAYPDPALADPPAIVAGSSDPLLDWALRESGAGLAVLFGGSGDGLARLARGAATVAGLHVLDPATGAYNEPALRTAGLVDAVLIHWAWRSQGLVVARGNPLNLAAPADLAASGARLALRQEGAGSRILLDHLLGQAGLSATDLARASRPALTEDDLAGMVADGEADCGLAVAAVARRFGLGFVPLARERFDLAVRRRFYFAQPFQTLLSFARTPAFAARAEALGGYDVGATGAVLAGG